MIQTLIQPVLYDQAFKLEEVFTDDEIILMFNTLIESKDYLKSIWGEWMKARDLCILAALRYMLLRPNEACSLKHSDFNWEKRLVHIRGENNKEKKDRFVAIPDNFVMYYKFFFTSFPSWMWKGSPYLFPSAENQHIHPQRWKMIFREKILKKAGLYEQKEENHMPRTRSYLLRKTGATEMLDNGASVWEVAQTLGHSNLNTVKNYYFQTNQYRESQANHLNMLK